MKVPIPESLAAAMAGSAIALTMTANEPLEEQVQEEFGVTAVEEVITPIEEPVLSNNMPTEWQQGVSNLINSIHSRTQTIERDVKAISEKPDPGPLVCPEVETQAPMKCGFKDRTRSGDPAGDYLVNNIIDMVNKSPPWIQECFSKRTLGPNAKQGHVVYMFELTINCVNKQQKRINQLTSAQRLKNKANELRGILDE